MNSYLRFGWPILSLVALIGVAVLLLLADVAREQDKTYENTTRDFVKQSSQTWVETNSTVATEYGLWSDAYQNITLSFAKTWIDANLFSVNVDATAVLSPTKGLRYTYLAPGMEDEGPSIKYFVAHLDTTVHRAYQLAPSEKTMARSPNGLMIIGDKLAAVTVQPIRPDPNFKGTGPSAQIPIDLLVVIKVIDADTIAALAKSYRLTDVKLHLGQMPTEPPSGRIAFELKDGKGQTLGWIDWVDAKPGTASFVSRAVPILLGLVLVGLLTLMISQHLLAAQVAMSRLAQVSAEEANHTKSSFLANVSHELRTPLNAIIGYSELVKEDCVESGASQNVQDMDRVIGSAHHLLGLINDLLDHSKIEAGKMDLNPTQMALLPIFDGVASALSGQLAKNNSQLVLNCDPLIGEAVLDGMRLKQCLLNLVSNAAKFTKDGKVTLSARSVDQGGVPFVRISVKDTGIGMSEATIAKLFMPFTQADATTASKFGGTGLGLVITSALVKAMGGSISVESVLGQGSTFTLLVPRGMASATSREDDVVERAA